MLCGMAKKKKKGKEIKNSMQMNSLFPEADLKTSHRIMAPGCSSKSLAW